MSAVDLKAVNKIYPNGFHAVRDLSLDITDGEFLVLVGPSGCGKSTALRMIAGLETISSGDVTIGGRVVNDLPPKDRDIAMVFQNYALYPHMTVAENIGFALKLQRVPRQDLDRRVLEAARMLELERWMDRKPGQLSGGQRQRVAMGRAIVRRPAAFLMDEPLSNLDAKLRVQMRSEIARLQRELKTTTVYVTHDQVEALTMGDRVAVLRDGELQQVSAPEDLYAEPDNLFVAAFIGSPAMNLLDGRVSIGASAPVVDFGSQQLELPASVLARRPGLRARDGQAVIVGIRPEDFEDAQISPPAAGTRLQGHVELREALGSELMVHVRTELRPAVAHEARAAAASGDTTAVETIERQARGGEAIVVASFDPRSRVRLGDAVEITVSTDRLYFFDPDTGLAIRES